MGHALKLFQVPPSPNNVKVRIALGYKGLEYDSWEVDLDGGYPGDRSAVIEVSTQPRTPVLQHGDVTMFDSGAILRYLEANFPHTPRLFSDNFETMGEIEEWEWLARASLSTPVAMMFREASAEQPNKDNIRRANSMLRNLTGRIEDRLNASPFLAGDAVSAADVTAAPMIALAAIPEDGPSGPLFDFFREHFKLPKDRKKTRNWVVKLLAYDTWVRAAH